MSLMRTRGDIPSKQARVAFTEPVLGREFICGIKETFPAKDDYFAVGFVAAVQASLRQ